MMDDDDDDDESLELWAAAVIAGTNNPKFYVAGPAKPLPPQYSGTLNFTS